MLIVLNWASFLFLELRKQDLKNRQNSTDDLDEFVKQKLELQMKTLFDSATALYQQMLEEGVAKECVQNGLTTLHTNKNLYDRFL